MGVSYAELGRFSSVTHLYIVVLFSCSSCIVSVLPFWYAEKLGELSELNAESNVGSWGDVRVDWYTEPVEGWGGWEFEQVIWKKMTDLGIIKCDGESDYKQCIRMKETGAKAKTWNNKCEHLDRVG